MTEDEITTNPEYISRSFKVSLIVFNKNKNKINKLVKYCYILSKIKTKKERKNQVIIS